jgi:hypothetical protein
MQHDEPRLQRGFASGDFGMTPKPHIDQNLSAVGGPMILQTGALHENAKYW